MIQTSSKWSSTPGRSAECLKELVPADYTGLIECDGYSAYQAFIKQQPDSQAIRLAGSMAHVRRKFFDARAEGEDPQWVLAQIQRLYRIEARLREARAGPIEIRQTRQEESRPIIEFIHHRLQTLQASHKHHPRSLTGEAINFVLNQWDRLEVFVRDGREQIDVTAYLTDLFARLPGETNQTLHRLTPKAWAARHRQTKAAAAV